MVTHTKDNTKKPKLFEDFVATRYPLPKGLLTDSSSTEFEPTSYTQTSKDPKWRAAVTDEFNALHRNKTWQLVPVKSHVNSVGCKWSH